MRKAVRDDASGVRASEFVGILRHALKEPRRWWRQIVGEHWQEVDDEKRHSLPGPASCWRPAFPPSWSH